MFSCVPHFFVHLVHVFSQFNFCFILQNVLDTKKSIDIYDLFLKTRSIFYQAASIALKRFPQVYGHMLLVGLQVTCYLKTMSNVFD
jgi:hypothetical protein